MMRIKLLISFLVAGILSSWLATTPAQAAACTTAPCQEVFVAMIGTTIANNGIGACLSNSGSACNNFADAMTQVANGGTIHIIDGGAFYESVNVTKSVTIVSPLNAAIVPPSGSPAFNVATAGVTLELRGLTINGGGGGSAGINVTNAASVRIKDTLIKNFAGAGTVSAIQVKPNPGITTRLNVEDSQLRNNSFGIVADGTSGGTVRGNVTNSAVTTNTNNGITVSSPSTSVVLLIEGATITGNNFGLAASGPNAGMLVRNTSVTANSTGLFSNNSAALISYKNNSVNGNSTTDGTFTATITPQ